jgi:prepilin-type N-terminal cleavage/methylation domain-containing protein
MNMNRQTSSIPSTRTRRLLGMTLIELLVALAIGSFLMIGALPLPA